MERDWQKGLRAYMSWKSSVQRNMLMKKTQSPLKSINNEKDLIEVLKLDPVNVDKYLKCDEKYFTNIQHPESKEVTLAKLYKQDRNLAEDLKVQLSR